MQPVCFAATKMLAPLFLPGKRSPLIRQSLGIDESDHRPLVFCSLGGIPAGELPIDVMRQERRLHWLINADVSNNEEHLHGLKQLTDIPYRDIIASVDAVIGKPGYGMAVEAVAYGIPFVFTRRGHFPDEPVIANWLRQHARSAELSNKDWFGGCFVEPLLELFHTLPVEVPRCNGSEEAAREIQRWLQVT
jgi:hypothetical protein